MKLHIEHVFRGITLAEYEELYFDEAFGVAMCESVKLGRTVLRFDRSPDRIVRHVRVEPAREVPPVVEKILGGKRFSYVEEIEYALGTGRGTWRTVPSLLPDKVDARGTIAFESVDGGVRRVVDGDIAIGVFGIGAIVERFVVSEVLRSYDDAAAFTDAWIAKKG